MTDNSNSQCEFNKRGAAQVQEDDGKSTKRLSEAARGPFVLVRVRRSSRMAGGIRISSHVSRVVPSISAFAAGVGKHDVVVDRIVL